MRVANREIGERERWEEESYRYGDCRVGERGRRSILSGSKAFSEKPTISLFSVTPMSCSSCSRPPASPASPSAKTSNHFFFIYFDRYIRYLLFGIYPWTFLVAFTLLPRSVQRFYWEFVSLQLRLDSSFWPLLILFSCYFSPYPLFSKVVSLYLHASFEGYSIHWCTSWKNKRSKLVDLIGMWIFIRKMLNRTRKWLESKPRKIRIRI